MWTPPVWSGVRKILAVNGDDTSKVDPLRGLRNSFGNLGNLQNAHTNALIRWDEQSTPSSCKHWFSFAKISSIKSFLPGCPSNFVDHIDHRIGALQMDGLDVVCPRPYTLCSQRLSDMALSTHSKSIPPLAPNHPWMAKTIMLVLIHGSSYPNIAHPHLLEHATSEQFLPTTTTNKCGCAMTYITCTLI